MNMDKRVTMKIARNIDTNVYKKPPPQSFKTSQKLHNYQFLEFNVNIGQGIEKRTVKWKMTVLQPDYRQVS
jgi:hypothetical protein